MIKPKAVNKGVKIEKTPHNQNQLKKRYLLRNQFKMTKKDNKKC